MRNVKVVVWGIGAMGSGIAKMLAGKKGVDIVGATARRPALHGKDLYEFVGAEKGDNPPCAITNDVDSVIYKNSCDCVVICTDSHTKVGFDKMKKCLENGLNVVSIAEEMAYPQAQSPDEAKELDRLAKENGVSILGTGINPGFVLDYLVLALTGPCETVDSITARRVNDLSPFGYTVSMEQGVGITVDEFNTRVAENRMTGHVGFPESIMMIGDGLGINIDKIEETRDPIISKTHRETEHVKVEPGNLAGVRQRGFGYSNGKLVIEMDHPQQIHPQTEGTQTGDYIEIKGFPNISMQISPEIPGGVGTICMAVNCIPHVINATPGLKSMLDIPVPRAIMGSMADMVCLKD